MCAFVVNLSKINIVTPSEAFRLLALVILPIAGNELISTFAAGEAFLVKYRSTRPHY